MMFVSFRQRCVSGRRQSGFGLAGLTRMKSSSHVWCLPEGVGRPPGKVSPSISVLEIWSISIQRQPGSGRLLEPRSELSAEVRKWETSVGFRFSRFDSNEELVPCMVFARRSGAAAWKGFAEHLGVGDLVDFHPAPAGQRATAGTADLACEQLDDTFVDAVVMGPQR